MTTMDLLATMERRTLTTITAGVWIAASGVAAALAYELNRPLFEIGHSGAGLLPFACALLAGACLAATGTIFGWWLTVPRPIPCADLQLLSRRRS
jgi:hypothetical protein